MRIQTHCPDGTDRHCSGTVPMDLPYTGLRPDAITPTWTTKRGRPHLARITVHPPAGPEWLAANDPWLSYSEIEDIKTDGYFIIEADDFPHHDCCGACGSSESYDDEGNNITAL